MIFGTGIYIFIEFHPLKVLHAQKQNVRSSQFDLTGFETDYEKYVPKSQICIF